MKKTLLILFVLLTMKSFAQNAVGVFNYNTDIGAPEIAGLASYDESTQTYTLKAAAYMGEQRDGYHYLYNKLKGDFRVTANFKLEGTNEVHRKIGWMARASEAENAAVAAGFLYGDGLTAGQWRERSGAGVQNPVDAVWASKRNYQIIQLERKGNEFIVRAAQRGEPLERICSEKLNSMPEEVLVGLAITAHSVDIRETAKVWNVRIDRPVGDEDKTTRDGWIGCRMETMNVFDGVRKVIYEKDGRFEAPNWMPDGKKLLFNMDGALYTIPCGGGDIEKVNTGAADKLNNDHCISFDGKRLGISHNSGKGSNVYFLPVEGGAPQQITFEAPSYLHGWAPNNEDVVYVAQRNGRPVYDIYRKSINGGAEVKLTHTQKFEHVDGCEYSPDGKYIYYNGSKNGGTMQIWRMNPDGSGKKQLTFDEYNDWFPHISPDGKWMVFISFSPDIELNAHPSYQRVMLRMMPTAGGAPQVIAHLYGGQGTINVNSWSPDSQHIAFVSNSGKK